MSLDATGKAKRINLRDFRSAPMRTFHITWFTFFLCFFGWFGIAPLMPVVRDDLNLSSQQVGNIIIGSVSITIFARLLFGWLCDRIGPRVSYVILLVAGSIPVMAIGFSDSYESFLLFRLAIGITGASFVITQYHTTAMFAPGVVGAANATAAGWGNMGGGVTLMVMPLIFSGLVGAGFLASEAWRMSMLVPGVAMLFMAFVYYRFTQDTPQGNRKPSPPGTQATSPGQSWWSVCRDVRVWMLFVCYAACFGIEITIDNVATLYFIDTFHLELHEAGIIAGLFGLMNLFARALGGIAGDLAGRRFGLQGRLLALTLLLLLEGLGIILFSKAESLEYAIAAMLLFALFLKMANGATYAVVPFVNQRSVGIVSGIVGAGGNAGAVFAGLLFASHTTYRHNFYLMGLAVVAIALIAFILAVTNRRAETIADRPAHASREPVVLINTSQFKEVK